MATQSLMEALADRKPALSSRISQCVNSIQSYWSPAERERRQRLGEIRRRELTLLLRVLGSGKQPR